MKRIGKFLDFTYEEKIKNYDDVHMDMLYYILHITYIERFTTEESFKELLIRFFLIRDKNFEDYALDVIDEELILDGFIGDEYFSLRINDLVNLIGFSVSDASYNIHGSFEEFIDFYTYKVPSIKFNQISKNETEVNKEAMAFIFMGLTNLLEIENCTLTFRYDLTEISEKEINGAYKLADYVMNRLPTGLFEKYKNDFTYIGEFESERYILGNNINFDVNKNMDRESLGIIYDYLIGGFYGETFKEGGQEALELKEDYDYANEKIKFAYGVKHGYIILSEDRYSYLNMISPNFILDFDSMLGPDEQLYCTQDIYDMYEMEKWIHLVP